MLFVVILKIIIYLHFLFAKQKQAQLLLFSYYSCGIQMLCLYFLYSQEYSICRQQLHFLQSYAFFFSSKAQGQARSVTKARRNWQTGKNPTNFNNSTAQSGKSHSLNDADEILMKYRFMPHTHTHTQRDTVTWQQHCSQGR